MSRRNLWAGWAIIVAAAFAIVAVTSSNGLLYVVVAIVAGAGYSFIHIMTRKPPAEPSQEVPPGPQT
jgi:membrane protease YdiL (CAAX protease family)